MSGAGGLPGRAARRFALGGPAAGEQAEEAFQRGTQFGVRYGTGVRPKHHDEIEAGKFRAVPPEGLADQALYAIALDRRAGVAAGDRHADAGVAVRALQRQDEEVRIGELPPAGEHGLEGRLRAEAGGAGEAAGRGCQRDRVDQIGVRRARPLARRADSTFRPFLVAIRARKPWVRARLRTLG